MVCASLYEDPPEHGEPSPALPSPHPLSHRPGHPAAHEAGGPGRRHRYGRQRGAPVPGTEFHARLGPASPAVAGRFNVPMPPDAFGLEHEAAMVPGFNTPIAELTIVTVDCETTGQTPHHLVELGAVRFTLPGAVADGELFGGVPPPDAMETLVHTTDHINSYARRVHGITRDMLAGTPPADLVLRRFLRFARGAVLVEHSADAFDTRLIARTLGHPIPHPTLDTSRLAKVLFDLRDTIGLERLCERLGVPQLRPPHHALADAEATAGCFVRLVELGQARLGWATLGDLHAVGHPPGPRVRLAPTRHARVRHGTGGLPRPGAAAAGLGEAGAAPSGFPVSPLAPAPVDLVGADGTAADGSAPAPRRRRRRGGRGRRRPVTCAPPAAAADTGGAQDAPSD